MKQADRQRYGYGGGEPGFHATTVDSGELTDAQVMAPSIFSSIKSWSSMPSSRSTSSVCSAKQRGTGQVGGGFVEFHRHRKLNEPAVRASVGAGERVAWGLRALVDLRQRAAVEHGEVDAGLVGPRPDRQQDTSMTDV